MWHNEAPHYVHPRMRAVLDRLGDGLRAGAPTAEGHGQPDRPERIFVSRRSVTKRRTCRNALEVEEYFAAHGFSVVYPELLDLGEQVAVFAAAKVVAGFGGSAMFNMAHAKQATDVILLSHEAYTARNEHLFSMLLDCDTHYFWSAPDVPHPEDSWTQEAFI